MKKNVKTLSRRAALYEQLDKLNQALVKCRKAPDYPNDPQLEVDELTEAGSYLTAALQLMSIWKRTCADSECTRPTEGDFERCSIHRKRLVV